MTPKPRPLAGVGSGPRRIAPLLLLACLAATNCGRAPSNPLPPSHIVDVLDTKLGRFPCIGDIRRWERRCRFERTMARNDPHYGDISLRTIEFQLWRPGPNGAFGVRPGRRITPAVPLDSFTIDDRPVFVAWGRYDRSSRTLTLTDCGPNLPS